MLPRARPWYMADAPLGMTRCRPATSDVTATTCIRTTYQHTSVEVAVVGPAGPRAVPSRGEEGVHGDGGGGLRRLGWTISGQKGWRRPVNIRYKRGATLKADSRYDNESGGSATTKADKPLHNDAMTQ